MASYFTFDFTSRYARAHCMLKQRRSICSFAMIQSEIFLNSNGWRLRSLGRVRIYILVNFVCQYPSISCSLRNMLNLYVHMLHLYWNIEHWNKFFNDWKFFLKYFAPKGCSDAFSSSFGVFPACNETLQFFLLLFWYVCFMCTLWKLFVCFVNERKTDSTRLLAGWPIFFPSKTLAVCANIILVIFYVKTTCSAYRFCVDVLVVFCAIFGALSYYFAPLLLL
jgi:hypothetical protein